MILDGILRKTPQLLIFSFFGGVLIDQWVLGSTVDSICAPEVCLNGSISQLSFGAVLEDSLNSNLLIPGNYSRFRDATVAHANPGFAAYQQQAGLVVTQTSPLIAYPRPLYQDQPQLFGGDSTSSTIELLRSFLLVKGYQATFGINGVPKISVHDSSPDIKQWNGLEDLELISVESSKCLGGCGAGGTCSQSASACVCLPGYTGLRCDSCANGYYGTNCQKCPDCDKSSGITCDDGTTGTGTCISLNYNKTEKTSLSLSQSTCNCLNGVCTGPTSCLCSAGWTNSPNGTLCASCMPGFFLDARGECVACGPGCQSCDTPSGICNSCVQGFQVSKDDSAKCVPSTVDLIGGSPTSCNDGFYNSNNFTCAPCHSSCKSCFGPSSSSCNQCSPTQGLLSTGSAENNTLSASCVSVDSNTGLCSSPPNSVFLFNQSKGICDPAPRLCSVAAIPGFSPPYPGSTSTTNAVCSACVSDAFLLSTRPGASEGVCVGVCPNGTYDDHHGHCTSCPTGCSTCNITDGRSTDPMCMTCTDPSMFLSAGTCVRECPAGTFASVTTNDTPQTPKGVNVCLPCSASCGNCTQFPTVCRSCPKNRPAFDPTTQTCALACPKGSFPDSNAGGRCSLCEPSCETCSGPGSSNCLSCKVGETLQDGKCLASSCATNTTQIIGWGVCLEDLLATNAVVTPKGLPAWLIVFITLFLSVGLSALCLVIWRFLQRKKRQEKTNQFGTDLTKADIKLHELDGPVVQESYRPGLHDDSMRPVVSPWPSPPTPTPSEFKIKRKVVPTDNRIDDEDRESIPIYNHTDCHPYPAQPYSVPELPSLPEVIHSDGTTAQDLNESCRTVQGTVWFENGLGRRPSQHMRLHTLRSPKSTDSFGYNK